jgi:hypothetical protein
LAFKVLGLIRPRARSYAGTVKEGECTSGLDEERLFLANHRAHTMHEVEGRFLVVSRKGLQLRLELGKVVAEREGGGW